MSKRFTDTELWKSQRWFRKLSPDYKLAFLYIKDRCDHAGIWNIDCADLMEDVGLSSFNLEDFCEKCNTEYDKITGTETLKERVRILDKGYLWVTGFVQFQYKGREGLVNPLIRAVRSALQILKGFGILEEALLKGYITLSEESQKELTLNKGLVKGSVTLKDKDKDKDKDKGIGKGGMGEKGKGEIPASSGENLCYNIEQYLLANQAQFDVVCQNAHKDPEFVKLVLKKYHLSVVEKDDYPKKPLQLIAGLQKWILNEKNFQKNGHNPPSAIGQTIEFD